VLLGLTTAQKFGLAATAFVFVGFSLLVSMVIPRYRPDFPGRRHLGLFIAVTIVLLVAMLGAVEVFAKESEEEPHEEAAAQTTTGGTTTGGGGGAGTTLENPADRTQLRFAKSSLEAPAGRVTLEMPNPSALEHDISIRGNGIDQQGEVVGQGGTSRVSAQLTPGSYEFYCSVPGHEQAGMKGTLTITG
jgi:uncharacterized cupredoxin-like copper-binding protein